MLACIWGATSDSLRWKTFIVPLIASLIAATVCIPLFKLKPVRVAVNRALGNTDNAELDSSAGAFNSTAWKWFVAGFIFVAVCIIIQELKQPLFFNQDDGFSLGTPYTLDAYRSILNHVFPAWTPHQLMGNPLMSNPENWELYPPYFLSYLIARFGLGRETATMDVFSIMHLVLLYIVVFRFAIYLKMRPMLATLASLCFTLSGYSLILGRSWQNIPAHFIVLTLLCWQAYRLARGARGWSWALWTGVLIGVCWYLGNAQFWAYNCVFLVIFLAIFLATQRITLKRLCWIIPAFLFAFAIMAPLLVPQTMEMHSLYDSRARFMRDLGQGIECGIPNMIVPAPFAIIPAYGSAISTHKYGPVGAYTTHYDLMSQYFYSGTLFPLVGAVLLLGLLAIPVTKRMLGNNPFLFCAVITLIFALGTIGGLSLLLKHIPFLAGFRGPFKYMGYLNLFLCLGIGVAIERYLRSFPRMGAEFLMVVIVGVGLLYQCLQPLPGLCNFDNVYSPLPKEFSEVVKSTGSSTPERIWSAVITRNLNPEYSGSLALGFGAYYGLYMVNGYDPLYELAPINRRVATRMAVEPIESAYQYGVRWIVVNPPRKRSLIRATRGFPLKIKQISYGPGTYQAELWCLPKALPLAFSTDDPMRALPIKIDCSGVDVTLPQSRASSDVVVNFLYHKFFRAEADGKPVKLGWDSWDRIFVTVPPGARSLKLRYCPPWGEGFAVAAALALAASLLCFAPKFISRRSDG
jgi:hypothetical protein